MASGSVVQSGPKIYKGNCGKEPKLLNFAKPYVVSAIVRSYNPVTMKLVSTAVLAVLLSFALAISKRLSYIESTDFCGNGILRVDLCKNFGKTSMILVIEAQAQSASCQLKCQIQCGFTRARAVCVSECLKHCRQVQIPGPVEVEYCTLGCASSICRGLSSDAAKTEGCIDLCSKNCSRFYAAPH
ncbi:hypothetical protein WN943_022304 [Citrus x changshan-huyou]